jgi:hypothetical protein
METENRDRKYERKQGNKKSIRKPRDSRRVDNTVPEDHLEDEMFLLRRNLARQQGYDLCRCGTARPIEQTRCQNCN